MAVHYITINAAAGSSSVTQRDATYGPLFNATGGTLAGTTPAINLVWDVQFFANKGELIQKAQALVQKLIETPVATLT